MFCGVEMLDGVVFWVYVVFMACLLCLMHGHHFAGLGLHGGLGMCTIWS